MKIFLFISRRASDCHNHKNFKTVTMSYDTAANHVNVFNIHGVPLSEVTSFKYLGSILSTNCSLDFITQQISAATQVYGALWTSGFNRTTKCGFQFKNRNRKKEFSFGTRQTNRNRKEWTKLVQIEKKKERELNLRIV